MGESVRIDDLSTEERLELLERVWDSLTRSPGELPPISAAQRSALDRRSQAFDQGRAGGELVGVPWDEVLRQLRARR